MQHHYGVTLANSGEFSLDMIGELLTHKSIVGIARNDAETPCFGEDNYRNILKMLYIKWISQKFS